MVIATVVEGPTDRIVLEEVLSKLLPDGDHIFLPFQPQETLGELGSGWKGVRKWCRQTIHDSGLSLNEYLSADAGEAVDLLVIHLDAEIVHEHDLQEGIVPLVEAPERLCPPIVNAALYIEEIVLRWLGDAPLPKVKVVFAIPGQDMETWIFAALYSGDPLCQHEDFECRHRKPSRYPGYQLTLAKYNNIFERDHGKPKKTVVKYRNLAPLIAENWPAVCLVCTQAQRFMDATKTIVEAR